MSRRSALQLFTNVSSGGYNINWLWEDGIGGGDLVFLLLMERLFNDDGLGGDDELEMVQIGLARNWHD